MIHNTEPVEEMLEELRAVERSIYYVKHVLNHASIEGGVRQCAEGFLLSKLDYRHKINWLLEEEFVEAYDIGWVLDYNQIENIQRVVN